MKVGKSLFFLVFCTGCFLNNAPYHKEYTFTLNYELSPAQDTFHIGDTIWIESVIPNEIVNEINQEIVDISEVNFAVYIIFTQIDTNGFAPAERYFDYLVEEGNLFFDEVSTWTNILLYYEEGSSEKKLKFGCIPQRSCVISLGYYSLERDIEDIQISNCIEEIKLFHQTNTGNAESNHYYFIEESNNPWA